MQAVVLRDKLHCGACGSAMHLEYRRNHGALIQVAECYHHACDHRGKLWKVPVLTVELEELRGAEG